MPFYVHAQDRPGAGSGLLELAEAHWSYMDRVAGRLMLRGPTLSDDGTEHTGSVHVIDLADRASAERFAAEEPYQMAGLYQQVTIVRAVILLDRGPAAGPPTCDAPNALITGRYPPEPRNASGTSEQLLGVDPDSRVRFVAVLTDDDQSCTTGIVAVVSALPGDALGIAQAFAGQLPGEPAALTAQRWRRGGRA